MYFFLSNAIKERIIRELRAFWSYDPRHKDIINNIQSKYSWAERPQEGMVVKTGGSQSIRLSADNYAGEVISYVSLSKIENHPGTCVEWVRENSIAIQNNQGYFPSEPGVYIVEITESDLDQAIHSFTVNSFLTVLREELLVVDKQGMTQSPFLEGTLQIYEAPSGLLLKEGRDYSADPETGEVIFTQDKPEGILYTVDYRKEGGISGPFQIKENRAHFEAIPGVVLAFGRRVSQGDKVAISVYPRREPTALQYHGKWEIPVEIDIFARDVYEAGYIVDSTAMFLNHHLRASMSGEGHEIMDVSIGGEMEDIYDENADDYLFGGNISLSIQVNWFINSPLTPYLKRFLTYSQEELDSLPDLSDSSILTMSSNIEVIEGMVIRSFEDPWFDKRNKSFETIR